MAIDILFISAMSAEVERVFFDTKNTMGAKRQRLKASTIETVKSLKSWFRLDLFTQKDLNEMMEVDLDLGE